MSKRSTRLRSRIQRSLTIICGIVLGSLVAAGPVSSANASSTNNLCEFGIFIGVRGTNAAAGSNLAHSNRVWLSGGFGDQVGDLKSILANSNDPIPYFFESLNYAASGDIGIVASEITGRNNLVNELNWLSSQCGASLPAVVLAGHSQGALVIEDALQYNDAYPNLTAKAKTMIRAVALFGDPTYVPSDPFNAPGSRSGHSILGRSSSQSAALAAYKYLGWPQGSSSQGWVYKIREYCLTGDAVCQSGSGANAWTIHNSYRPVKTTNAKSWIEYMLTSSV